MRATIMAKGGMGLAAPQVGVSARVMVMRRTCKLQRQRGDDLAARSYEVCINPRVLHAEAEEVVGPEGCYSVPGHVAFVSRPGAITVEWLDETGTRVSDTLCGVPAVVFQHELDHLDGVLILDKDISGIAGTPEGAEASRRFTESLNRHYTPGLRPAGPAAPATS
ncbi:hypothetical protein FNF27_07212 [Cafeteria roenbergensis]|uniref:Peptide deformylase n=2 Tax=Cafeteria roenbergensis TaxID=33653 RepID=A0A5A8D9C1_CAFRO|nr:hypothetical protein FNF29_01905 [Cafeteria roenbergensis]KAA0161808.1 hypothetical protein FNF31_03594 [Cafeteria roenbergensis]KAA0167964.1 hypothetical protein FNF27_07212 [Cafeteria roenbergensis]|eukprot:KAA0155154.1 hypothetical protein FNF29_01905 [Cafeteria roenbergensis]